MRNKDTELAVVLVSNLVSVLGKVTVTNIFFVNNEGGGFADRIDVQDGTTIGELCAARVGVSVDRNRFNIRVNRDVVPADYVLQSGDRVTITPNKIEGAL